jgi:predicted acetyltransferase
MSIEIRQIATDEEAAQHGFISAYSFNGSRTDEALARRGVYYPREWCWGAFEGGTLVAGLVIIPFEQFAGESRIPVGGIASVSCLPERRREGFVAALLQRSLEVMRGAGQPLSELWTPHYSLYRRFGYEIAHRMISYSFPPKITRPRFHAPAGRWRRVDAEAWRDVDALYARHYASRNGAFIRTELHWRNQVFTEYGARPRDAAIWSNAAGEDRGYVIYRVTHRDSGPHWGQTTLRVADWVALDAEAYAAVLAYLLGHDLVDQIVLLASVDDPLADALEEPVHVQAPPGAWYGPMLRLVDVRRAFDVRRAPAAATAASVTVALADRSAPWNAGMWHIGCRDGRMFAECAPKASPDVEMDVRALAPLYNGFLKPSEAARVGTIRVQNPDALDALAVMFQGEFSPYCPDDF